MSYIYTRKNHEEESSYKRRIPKESSFRGRSPKGKFPLPLISKGERLIRCIERKA
jgi:hypothetical protein